MSSTATQTLVPPDVQRLSEATDVELLDLQAAVAEVRRRVDATAALIAGEVARRSSRELGYDGLAQRSGARTPDALVARVAGVTGAEARDLVQAGAILAGEFSWMTAVADELLAGSVSVGSAAAIQLGLGRPSDDVPAEVLAAAAARVLEQAGSLPPKKVAARARRERDELDEAGVADREALRRDRRFLRLIPRADGMTRIVGLLDPESAALVTDALDCITAPRRGGVRFVDPEQQRRGQAIIDDPRTTEQLAVDALVHMVHLAGGIDDGRVFGGRAPAVRVHVRLADLDRRAGTGHLEGQTAPVSIATVEREVCERGLVPILFDDGGSVLDLGRTQRLFTSRQRIAIAARDGGCIVGECDRPPSWTEAHHIDDWDAHHGRTDVADGVSLCRHHHMWIHNSDARIRRTGALYRIEHADGRVDELTSKSPIRHGAAA